MVRKVESDKTPVLHRIRQRQFTDHQITLDVQKTAWVWKLDPKVINKQIYLYARAWELENEKPIFDSDYNNAVPPNSPENTIRYELAADKTGTIPGTIRESSPEIFPQVDRSCDGTDVDHYMEPDADTSVEQPHPTPTKPRSSKYSLRHNPVPNCKVKYRFLALILSHYGLRSAYVLFPEILGT